MAGDLAPSRFSHARRTIGLTAYMSHSANQRMFELCMTLISERAAVCFSSSRSGPCVLEDLRPKASLGMQHKRSLRDRWIMGYLAIFPTSPLSVICGIGFERRGGFPGQRPPLCMRATVPGYAS